MIRNLPVQLFLLSPQERAKPEPRARLSAILHAAPAVYVHESLTPHTPSHLHRVAVRALPQVRQHMMHHERREVQQLLATLRHGQPPCSR